MAEYSQPTVWEAIQGSVVDGANGIDGNLATVAQISIPAGPGNFAAYGVKSFPEVSIPTTARTAVHLQVAAQWAGISGPGDFVYLWGDRGGGFEVIRRIDYPASFHGSYAVFDITAWVGTRNLADLRFQIAPADGPIDPPPTPPIWSD